MFLSFTGNDSEPDLEDASADNTRESNKARRRRTAFTSEQLLELEREFHAKKYLSLTERSQIASALKLSEVQVGMRVLSNHLCFRKYYTLLNKN